ncbi:MAG TPA: GH25 family lysozyme [Actinomycetota bacterium]|nr:GH25 family lysozyme [Actinomycetota bacterium]
MRRRVVVVGAAGAVAAAAATWWLWWVPAWRPPLQEGERYGIDVSSHQGRVDWARVAADGIEFAYLKASEGGDFVDERFAENWEGAAAAGLDRGAYHFFTLCTAGDVQARHFLAVAPPEEGALPPAVDLELAGNCGARPPAVAVRAELDRFLSLVETAWGQEIVLYVGEDFEERYPGRDRLGRPLWLRRFLVRPDGDWWIWQLHGRARVDGVEGGVDLDVMRGTARGSG